MIGLGLGIGKTSKAVFSSVTPINVSAYVTADARDIEERITGGLMQVGSTDLELNADSGNPAAVGVIFQNSDFAQVIPVGATITNAYIRFQCAQAQSSAACSVDIHGEIGDAADYTGATSNLTDRTRTTAKVDWDNLEEWFLDSYYDTPDISTVLQEVIDDAGYATTNAIGFVFMPTTGTDRRVAASYDHATLDPPQLFVTFTT